MRDTIGTWIHTTRVGFRRIMGLLKHRRSRLSSHPEFDEESELREIEHVIDAGDEVMKRYPRLPNEEIEDYLERIGAEESSAIFERLDSLLPNESVEAYHERMKLEEKGSSPEREE